MTPDSPSENRKPILICFPSDATEMTGGLRFVLNVAQAFDNDDYEPVFVTTHSGVLTRRLEELGIETIELDLPDLVDVFDEDFSGGPIVEKLAFLVSLVLSNIKVASLVKRRNIEICWGRNSISMLMTGIAAKGLRLPLIWDIGAEPKSEGIFRLVHMISMGLSDGIFMEAAVEWEDFFEEPERNFFEGKLQTCFPALDPDRMEEIERAESQSPDSDSTTILNVATVHPRKNQLGLIKAAAPLLELRDDLEIRIAGDFRDEEYAKEIVEFTEARGIDSQVHLLGWHDDIPGLMAQSDLFALSSHIEGVPYVIREAMFAELPIVATKVGGIPDVVEDGRTGLLVEPDDEEALRDRLVEALDEPEKRRSLAREARRFAEEELSPESWGETYREKMMRVLS